MSKIQTTTDYSKFKFCKFNREIDRGHVKKLTISISTNNLLEFCPILVDKNMQIIDGQHRFLAAQEAGVPVFYQIKADSTDEDIVLLNVSSKRWIGADYVNYYAKKGNKNYQNIIDLSEKYNLTISIVLNLFGKDFDGFKKMKSGNLSSLDMEFAEKKIQEVTEISALISQYLPNTSKRFIKNCKFLRSLVVFLSDDEIDFKDFKKRVYWRLNAIHVCSTLPEYMDMWNMIYSYRRRKEEA